MAHRPAFAAACTPPLSPSPGARRHRSAARTPVRLALVAAALALVACGDTPAPGQEPAAAGEPSISPLRTTAFRVRELAQAPLNADTGWAAPQGEPAVALADRPFRIRFEIAAPEGVPAGTLPTRFTLQARRNEGAWETLALRDFPYPDELSTPRVSLVRAPDWGTGEPADDLLEGVASAFAPGEGVSDPVAYDDEGDALASDSASSPWPAAGGPGAPVHGEWEWPVVIRRWADGAVTNEAGDTFDFRMVDGAGRPVAGAGPVRVTLRLPEGLLGGTYVETPGVLGPWQADAGTLFFPMEPAETFNVLMMVASEDHGATWHEVDGANRPATDDLEGFAAAQVGDTVHLLHQISEATVLHAFDMASGRWVIRDEPVATHSEPPTQVAALVPRTDGGLVAFYGDSLGLLHRTRAPGGGWGDERRVPVEGAGVASGVMATRAADERVHLAYTVTAPEGGARSVRHRTLAPDGSFGPETVLGEGIDPADDHVGAVLPLGWVAEPNTVVVAWRDGGGILRERRVRDDGSVSAEIRVAPVPVLQSGADSEQVGADLLVHDGVVHIVYIDREGGELWHTSSAAPGSWSAPRPVVRGIDAQWVRGRVVEDAEGRPVYGLVYDAGSDGGSGMNRYVEIQLQGG